MAKIIATTFGAALVLFGLAGFASPVLLGAHLSAPLNGLHLLLGAVVLYVGQRAGPSVQFWSCLGVGALLLLGGLLGIILGQPGTSGLGGLGPEERLWIVIPGWLELGRPDHVLHLFFGIAVVTAAVVSAAETPFRLHK